MVQSPTNIKLHSEGSILRWQVGCQQQATQPP